MRADGGRGSHKPHSRTPLSPDVMSAGRDLARGNYSTACIEFRNQKTEREVAMRQFMMTVIAVTAFGAMVATAQAENQNFSSPAASHPVKKRSVS
jgi:hypothetical protein